MGELLQRYDKILTQAVDFHEAQPPLQIVSDAVKRRGRPKRRTGQDLALRLQKRKAEVIRFLTDPNVLSPVQLEERIGIAVGHVSSSQKIVAEEPVYEPAHVLKFLDRQCDHRDRKEPLDERQKPAWRLMGKPIA